MGSQTLTSEELTADEIALVHRHREEKARQTGQIKIEDAQNALYGF